MNRKFSVNWTDGNSNKWKDWLSNFIGKDDIIALEVGCYEGRSSCWFCENILTGEGSRLTCIDDWTTNQAELLFDKNIVNLKINKIKGKSQIVLPALISKNSKYNFIYIDADHHSSSVLRDLCLSWELLKRGGVIICDDYSWTNRKRNSSPKLAIDSWLICNKDIIEGYEIYYRDFNNAQCAIWKK